MPATRRPVRRKMTSADLGAPAGNLSYKTTKPRSTELESLRKKPVDKPSIKRSLKNFVHKKRRQKV